MKVFSTEDTTPVNSIARSAEAAVVPPFTFVGPISIGKSPIWSPHSSYFLTVGYAQARTYGTKQAGFAVMKMEGGAGGFNEDAQNHVILGSVIMAPDAYKKTFVLGGPVTPYDAIYILSFAASGHTDVVIQILGERAAH